MKTASLDQVIDGVKNGKLNYYNIYNLDIDSTQYNSINYYNKYSNVDNISKDQKLNILFLDIEVYLKNDNISIDDLQKYTQYPINAITIYSTFERIYHMYYLILPVIKNKIPDNTDEIEKNITEQLKKDTYLDTDEIVKIYTFKKETDLLESFWNKVHEIDPSIISG